MLDKIFNKKKKDEDIFCVPQRKNNIDFKNLSKLGPKALQEIVEQQEKYISVLTGRIQDIVTEYRKVKQKSTELQQKNDVINAQISKMTNQHEELTIKFDNLQNSLEVMIATNQQQLNSQLDFLRTQSKNLNSKQSMPKTIDQVFSMYQDRFALCSKITNQNKFLKEKINDIELKLDEIKERYDEVEKQKGVSNLIPSLMESLQELKKERKNENLLSTNASQIHEQKDQPKTFRKIETKQMQTMTIKNQMQSQKVRSPSKQIFDQCFLCTEFKFENESLKDAKQSLLQDIGQWSEKCQNLQNDLIKIRAEKAEIERESQIIMQETRNLKDQLQKIKLDVKSRQEENKKLIEQQQSFERNISEQKEQNRAILRQLQQKSIQITVKQAQLGKMTLQLAQCVKVDREEKEKNDEKNQSQEKEGVASELLLYEEKIKELCAQNQQCLAQIQTLKQEAIGKSSEIMTLKQQTTELLKQNNTLKQQVSIITQQKSTLQEQAVTLRQQITTLREKLEQSTKKISNLTQSLQESQQFTARLQETQKQQEQQSRQRESQTLSKITSLQTKTAQTDKQLIFLRNNRQTIENDNKRMLKQKKLSQDAIKDLQQYKSDIEQRILPQLRSQNELLKRQFKQLSQQKQIMQQHNLQTVNSINSTSQQLIKQIQQLKREKTQLEGRLVEVTKQSQSRNIEIETFQQTINKLNREMTEKMLAMDKVNNQCKKKQQQIEELCEELKSKQRKYEGELNQERIKAETMKRTIAVQETKLQENEKSSNKFYEESMHKDKKITYMEIKLKEYKHLIQSLKKEKDELEKAFNEKIKSYEDIIPEVVSEEQLSTTQRKRSSEMRQVSKSDGQLVEVHTNDKDTDYLKNQILSYEEANIVLKQENSHLREKIKQLEDESNERKRQIYSLQEKREQTLKEIQKLNIRSINGTLQPISSQFTQKEKQFIREKEGLLAEKQKSQQRIKKVASKAYKGFDILLKKHQTLYKDFIAVFVKQINTREEVKNIEAEINLLINKTTDMKDVFQDYL